MSVLDRDALGESPLADLHVLAAELGVDGFRRLRRDDLIGAILKRQGSSEDDPGEAPAHAEEAFVVPEADEAAPAERESAGEGSEGEEAADDEPARPRRRRGGRGRRRGAEGEEAPEPAAEERAPQAPRKRPTAAAKPEPEAAEGEEKTAEGTVELLDNGSAFLRVAPPDHSDGDAYVSAAQVRRCELVSGDRVTGPVRPPRRSERHPSLVRVETINGQPADEVPEGTRWDDLPAAYPRERFEFGAEDPTVKAIEWLTPFGRGSRVLVVGPSRAGKTEALRRLAASFATHEGTEVTVALAGVRPEELAEWADGPVEPAAALSFAASPDAQGAAVERAVEQARRVAARGGHAVVLVDTLAHLPASTARRILGAARSVRDGGSLTIVATAHEPLGGETTVIALDVALTGTGRFPAIDLAQSGTLRPELLVGDAGAEAIANARSAAAE